MRKAIIGVVLCVLVGGCDERAKYGIADQVAKVRGSVVHIEKVGKCQGSGCIVSADGIIFTAKHITDGGGKFVVTLDDGTKYETELCIESKEYDVAFLKISPVKPLQPALLSNMDLLRVGDRVFVMGSPFGSTNFNSVSLGILSSKQRNLDVEQNYDCGWHITFQTDATIEPGSSGGPVFDFEGRVIGVTVAEMDATVNYAVPVAVFSSNMDTVRLLLELSKFEVQENIGDYEPFFQNLYDDPNESVVEPNYIETGHSWS